MENVQHHAFPGLGLLRQGLCPLNDPGIQLPGQLLRPVKLQGIPAADVGHAAQSKRRIVDPGTPEQVEKHALLKKRHVHARQDHPYPEANGDGTGKQHQQGSVGAPGIHCHQYAQTVAHAQKQPYRPYTAGGNQRQNKIPQCQKQGTEPLPVRHRHSPCQGGAQQNTCQNRDGKESPAEKDAPAGTSHRSQNDHQSPEGQHRQIKQKIPQFLLRLVSVQGQHHRPQSAEYRYGHPLQHRAEGQGSHSFFREQGSPCHQLGFGVHAGDPKIRQCRQSLVEPDPCQPNGQCQCPGSSRKQKSLFYHKKTPCKTLENRLRTARKYGILDKDIIANSRRKGEGKPHDPHSSGGR